MTGIQRSQPHSDIYMTPHGTQTCSHTNKTVHDNHYHGLGLFMTLLLLLGEKKNNVAASYKVHVMDP